MPCVRGEVGARVSPERTEGRKETMTDSPRPQVEQAERTLASYRPQHDEECATQFCICGRPYIHIVHNGHGHSYTKDKDANCSCGLDILIKTAR